MFRTLPCLPTSSNASRAPTSTSPTIANLNIGSLRPRVSSWGLGSAPTNAPSASGQSSMATAIRSCATRSGAPRPSPALTEAPSHLTRAAFAVVATAAIFEELIKHARWSELVQWSAQPALYTRFHFGKYRRQRYADIAASDPDYLRWI